MASLLISLPEHRFRKYDVSTPTLSPRMLSMETWGDLAKSPRTFFQKSLTVIAERGNDSQRSSCDAKYRAGADEPHGDERDVPLCAILRKGGSR